MDQFNTAPGWLTIANSAAILGVSIYYYQQINNLQVEMKKYISMTDSCIIKYNELLSKLGIVNGMIESLKKLDAGATKMQKSIKANNADNKILSGAYMKLLKHLVAVGSIEKIDIKKFTINKNNKREYDSEDSDNSDDEGGNSDNNQSDSDSKSRKNKTSKSNDISNHSAAIRNGRKK